MQNFYTIVQILFLVFTGVALVYGTVKLTMPAFKAKAQTQTLNAYNAIKNEVQAITETLILCLYICKPNGNCIYASEGLCNLFRRTAEDMLCYGWTLAVKEQERNRAYTKWVECVKNNLPYEDIYQIETAAGVFEVYTNTHVVYDYDTVAENFKPDVLFYIGTVKVIKEIDIWEDLKNSGLDVPFFN